MQALRAMLLNPAAVEDRSPGRGRLWHGKALNAAPIVPVKLTETRAIYIDLLIRIGRSPRVSTHPRATRIPLSEKMPGATCSSPSSSHPWGYFKGRATWGGPKHVTKRCIYEYGMPASTKSVPYYS